MSATNNSKFTSYSPANPSNVISHMIHETEKQIEKMTGQRVKLGVENVEE